MSAEATRQGTGAVLIELAERFLPTAIKNRGEDRFRGLVVVALSTLLSVFGPIYAVLVYQLSGDLSQGIATLMATAGVIAGPILMRRGFSFVFIGNWLTFSGYALFFYVSTQNLGPSVLIWQIVFLILAALIAGRTSAMIWLAIMAITTAYFYGNLAMAAPQEGAVFTQAQIVWEMALIIGMYIAVMVLTLSYETLKDWALSQAKKREAHTRAILDSASDGILSVTMEGKISDANPESLRLFGYSRSELEHLPLSILVPDLNRDPSGAEQEKEEDVRVLDGPLFRAKGPVGGFLDWVGSTYELSAQRCDGSRFPVEVSITPIDQQDRFVVILRDITIQKAAEDALRKARDQAIEASEAKSRFLANVSHELRTPLNAIIGYSELVTEDLDGEEDQGILDDVEKIGRAGRHLLNLINEILDLSKIEAGEMQVYNEEVVLAEVIDEVFDTIKPIVDRNGNTLRVDIDEAPAELFCDQMKLRQILLNLLSNASKFTRRGMIRIFGYEESDEQGEWVVLEVIDRGIGIPEEKLIELFDAFKQADNSTTRDFGGTGLGLTICKHFVELMGGTIAVDSQVGKGSTFRIRLPRRYKEEIVGSRQEESHGPLNLKKKASGSNGPLKRPRRTITPGAPRVLVIDDDPTVHNLMVRFLEKEGFQVETTTGGHKAIEEVRKCKPDVITLDVLMPEVDGWSLLTALKKDEELREIPVVMLTIINERNLGFSLGATDYLTKPVDPSRLVKVLSKTVADICFPVLIVEDDPSTREVLERMVSQSGFEAVVAEDGKVALDLLEQGLRPGAILLDLMMPRLDGFELLKEIRQRSELIDTAVIVVSAAELSKEERDFLKGRVTQILQKGSYAREQLLGELRAALHHRYRFQVPAPQIESRTELH